MVSESILPSKGELIKVCREKYKLDHSKLDLQGIPILKDRVVMAIYIAEMLQKEPELVSEEDTLGAFQEILGTRKTLQDEFKQYFNDFSQKHKSGNKKLKVKIMNSLEVNLMLAFLWLGCLTSDLPVIERDILEGAQRNKFGYLNEYEATFQLLFDPKNWPAASKPNKSFQTLMKTLKQKISVGLRPINVPFKNKWLREASRDLDMQIRLNLVGTQGQYPLYRRVNTIMSEGHDQLLLLKLRLQRDLGAQLISQQVIEVAGRIGERLLKTQGRESFESIFELLACYVLALKLCHGLTDKPDSNFLSLVRDSLRDGLHADEPPAWKFKDLARIADLRA